VTSTVFGQARPLTDNEFLALGETQQRVELFDGSLLLSARGEPRHQYMVQELARTLGSADGHVLAAVNVRLRPGRILVPDLVVTTAIDFDSLLVEAASVRMVVEVVSSSSAAIAEVLKVHYYSAAAIPWYLIVDQDSATLRVCELDGDHYRERSVTTVGQTLHLGDPFGADIAPADLLPPA
jgi:Uma2 family endonuclease